MPFTLRPFRRFPVWSLCVLLAVLTPSPAAAVSEYHGLVVRVLDGDTIEVLHNMHPERVRLSDIDCPEISPAW
jgi:endonuclease YncB( thermonuclease family)